MRKLHHHIHLNPEARADLRWWNSFLPSWNGISMFIAPEWKDADSFQLYTDASGSFGFGAYLDGAWFRGDWQPHQQLLKRSIQWQELFAIVAAALTWGHFLTGQRIRFHCDNLPIVQAWTNQSSRHPGIMDLLRTLGVPGSRHPPPPYPWVQQSGPQQPNTEPSHQRHATLPRPSPPQT